MADREAAGDEAIAAGERVLAVRGDERDEHIVQLAYRVRHGHGRGSGCRRRMRRDGDDHEARAGGNAGGASLNQTHIVDGPTREPRVQYKHAGQQQQCRDPDRADPCEVRDVARAPPDEEESAPPLVGHERTEQGQQREQRRAGSTRRASGIEHPGSCARPQCLSCPFVSQWMLDRQPLQVARPALGRGGQPQVSEHAPAGRKAVHRPEHAEQRIHADRAELALLVELERQVAPGAGTQRDGPYALAGADPQGVILCRRTLPTVSYTMSALGGDRGERTNLDLR